MFPRETIQSRVASCHRFAIVLFHYLSLFIITRARARRDIDFTFIEISKCNN